MARHDYWHDPKAPAANSLVVAVSAVVIDSGRLLIIRRTDNGLWSLPGGGMEPGETVSAAVTREVYEETGYEIRPRRLVGIFSDPGHVVAYDDGEVRQAFSICFDCELVGGGARTSEESSAVRWVPQDEADSLDMHQANRERIRAALDGGQAQFT